VRLTRLLALLVAGLALAGPAAAEVARVFGKRQTLFIVTSTLNRTYVDAISERFVSNYKYPPPLVKTTIANVAVEAFCAGIGTEYPDVVALPRRMSRRELETCIKNGMIDIVELDTGKDALVVVTKKGDPVFDLRLTDFFHALAAEIPKDAGFFADFVPNRAERWSDIDSTLPDQPIRVLGPAENTAILRFMKDFFLEGACRKIGAFKVYYHAEDRVRQCTTIRTDGVFQEVPVPIAKNFVDLMQKAPPGTLAVLPYTVWRTQSSWLDVLPVAASTTSPSTRSYSTSSGRTCGRASAASALRTGSTSSSTK